MQTKRLILLFIFICFTIRIFSQEFGLPFIKNYNPIDYNGSGQIWSIVQSETGIIYFGGNDGIYEYDGTDWKYININNKSGAISMDISKDGTIYVGSSGSFGYLKRNQIGQYEYIMLNKDIDSAYSLFSNVWNTFVLDNNVFFNTTECIYKYDIKEDRVEILKPENKFFLANKIYNQIYVIDIGVGLKRFTGDSLELVFGGEKFARNISWFMLPYNDKILLGNDNSGLSVYNPNTKIEDSILTKTSFNKKDLLITEKFIAENQLYSGKKLNDETYALGTINKGILIIDKSGKIVKNLNNSNGLNSQTVHYLYQDNQEGLWAGLTYGISRIEINSPFRFWNENTNLPGSIYNVLRFNEKIYASSNLGLYYMQDDIFFPIPELAEKNAIQVFEMQNLFFPDLQTNKLLVSATSGIWEISNYHAVKISEFFSFNIYQSRKNTNVIYIIQDYDVYTLEYNNGKWLESESLISFNSYPSTICEDNDFNLWFLIDSKPVLVNTSNNKFQIIEFTDNEDIKNIDFTNIYFIDNTIIFSTNKGFYSYKNNNFYKIDFQKLINDNSIVSLSALSNNIIAYIFETNSKNNLFLLNRNQDTEIVDTISFKRISEFDYTYADGDSNLWITSPQKLFKYNVKANINYLFDIKPIIRKIALNTDSLIFEGESIDSLHSYIFDYEYNNIKFFYSLPSFDNVEANKYSVCLAKNGKNEIWTSWNSETSKEYTNLNNGKYIFKIKAKNIYDIQTQIAEFKFEILTPWYKTYLAYIFYIILLIIIIYICAKLYSFKLLKEKQKLEIIVLERTKEISEKNTELQQQKEEIQSIADNLQELNETLLQKNEEINQQNEEIRTIADNLTVANDEISNQNIKILASIKYAQRIQEALLPVKENIEKYFPNNFVFYKPKDMVSGDFYWFKSIIYNNERLNLIIVADCTGHGVPGAMMSMLGISFLNEIIKHDDIKTPAHVLDRLRIYIKKALKQTGKDREAKDGMDIAFCVIYSQTLKLCFAGANLPVYITSKIGNEVKLTVIKGDRMPIGIYLNEKENFTDNEFQLKPNDCIYMTTDGYIDQLGGKDGRKFLSIGFQQLLTSICEKDIEQQSEIVESTFNEWINYNNVNINKQIDDVTVLGIKI